MFWNKKGFQMILVRTYKLLVILFFVKLDYKIFHT